MKFVKNCWYAGIWASLVNPGPQGFKPVMRKICGEEIVFFRGSKTMQVSALSNACPHRFAPLDSGVIVNDNIKCRYHGLQFDGNGACVVDPSGAKPPPIHVKKYPIEEKHGMIYIWIGDGEPTEPAPDWLAFGNSLKSVGIDQDFDQGFGGRLEGHRVIQGNFMLLVDNLVDDSHAPNLHALLSSDAHVGRPDIEIIDDGHSVHQVINIKNADIIPLFRKMYKAPPGTKVNQRVHLRWVTPTAVIICTMICGVDAELKTSVGVDGAHMVTPETETSCHYQWAFERNANLEDHAFTAQLAEMLAKIFKEEDSWIIEGTQRIMGDRDFWEMKPALMPSDKAAAIVRKRIDKMIADQ